jgi:hypothetical protein
MLWRRCRARTRPLVSDVRVEPCELSRDVRRLGSQSRLRVGTECEVVTIGADGAFEIADLRGEATLFRR